MRLSISKTEKNKGGRPRVDAVPVMVRLPRRLAEKVDKWRDKPKIGRPEAIRRLLEAALKID